MRRQPLIAPILCAFLVVAGLAAQEVKLPNTKGSLKLAVMGDNGNGARPQYEVAEMMAKAHEKFPFDTVIMLGDNMYGSQNPKDFETKFSIPYKPLRDKGVKFYAALGNHDNQENRFYKPWNMGGERFYTFKKNNVRFFVLDTDYVDPKQLEWIERELKNSTDDWKIVYFHHPLYSSGGRHGSELDLRVLLEPLFVKYGVNVAFQGHDHVYERVKPQNGIVYFVSGAAGQLRQGDLRKSEITAAGFDQDQSFMIVEIDKDEMWFQAITRSGKTVDSGVIVREKRGGATPVETAKPVPTTGTKPAPNGKPASPTNAKPEAPANEKPAPPANAKPTPPGNGKPAPPSTAKPAPEPNGKPSAEPVVQSTPPRNESTQPLGAKAERPAIEQKPKKRPWYCALLGC